MLFRIYGHAVLAMHERHSRMLIALRPPGKASAPIADAMSQALGQLPPNWRRTVTFDNGTEFARHHQLHALGVETFFCDTHSPLAEGRRGERHRPVAPDAAPQDRPREVV